jgi:hypothetical protein
MDWLRDFQQSFREPVYAVLGTYGPAIAIVVLVGLGWLFGSTRRRGSTSTDAILDESDGDGGGDGGGGD